MLSLRYHSIPPLPIPPPPPLPPPHHHQRHHQTQIQAITSLQKKPRPSCIKLNRSSLSTLQSPSISDALHLKMAIWARMSTITIALTIILTIMHLFIRFFVLPYFVHTLSNLPSTLIAFLLTLLVCISHAPSFLLSHLPFYSSLLTLSIDRSYFSALLSSQSQSNNWSYRWSY